MEDKHMLTALAAAREAGKVIIPYFRTSLTFESKTDGSPLTCADQASHKVIGEYLESTGLPVVSEEGTSLYMDKDRYWIVDPLDGTKEFLAGIEEFTINIALIENNKPVLGVMYSPVVNEMYAGIVGEGSWVEKDNLQNMCEALPKTDSLRMAVSRFHNHSDSDVFATDNDIKSMIALGSALKYGRLATGDVDVYARLVGTSEWDTGAGQAILEAAGGSIIDLKTGLNLSYGKPNRRNGKFIAFRSPYTLSDFNLRNI